jgi:hypothetical protein
VFSALPATAPVLEPRPNSDALTVRTEWVLTVILRLQLAAALEALQGSGLILGGEASGPLMQGPVQPGTFDWSHDPARRALQVTACFDVQGIDGGCLRISDRAMVYGLRLAQCGQTISTVPHIELLGGDARNSAPALYVGRMDARELGAGKLRMDAHRIL